MLAMLVCELKHMQRGLYWQLLLILAISAALHLVFGAFAVALILSPLMANAVGVSAFAEEYTKGEMRFLFSMPISRSAIWCVKFSSGIVAIVLLVVVVLLPGLVIDKPVLPIGRIGPHDINLEIGSLVFVGIGLVAYGAGLFTIGFCQVPGTAVLLAGLLSLAPMIIPAAIIQSVGLMIPSTAALATGLIVASLPLFAGAYVLFRVRNPFIDQPWRWRGIAMPFAIGYVLCVIVACRAAVHYPAELTDPHQNGIVYIEVLGNGSEVLAMGRRNLLDLDVFVLDHEGRIARELFHADNVGGALVLPSQIDSPPYLLYQQREFTYRETAMPQMFVLNVTDGVRREIPSLTDKPGSTFYQYHGVSRDGASALGLKRVQSDHHVYHYAFMQGVGSETSSETFLFAKHQHIRCIYLDDRHILAVDDRSSTGEPPELTVIDLDSGEHRQCPLPPDTHRSDLSNDGKFCAALRWSIEGDTVSQELSVINVLTGETATVLTGSDLPQLTMRDAIRQQRSLTPVVQFLSHSNWIECTLPDLNDFGNRWLINRETAARCELPKCNSARFTLGSVSPDNSRVFFSKTSEGREADDESDVDRRLYELEVHEITANGLKQLSSTRMTGDEVFGPPNWLGNDRLLYRAKGPIKHIFARRELWVVDVLTGERRLFVRR